MTDSTTTVDARVRIYAGPPLLTWLDRRPLFKSRSHIDEAMMDFNDDDAEAGQAAQDRKTISVSSSVNCVVERYMAVMRNSLPELNDETWFAIANAMNGKTEHSIDQFECLDIANEVLFDHGVDLDELSDSDVLRRFEAIERDTGIQLNKLMNLSYAETLAIVDAVERFWGRQRDDQRSLKEQIVES